MALFTCELPVHLFDAYETHGNGDQENKGAGDTVDPHILSPILFAVTIRSKLDKAEEAPADPEKPAMKQGKVEVS